MAETSSSLTRGNDPAELAKSSNDSAVLEQALAALHEYRPGSARGLLVPIDDAAVDRKSVV